MGTYNEKGQLIDYKGDLDPASEEEARAKYVGWFRDIYEDAEALAEETGYPVDLAFHFVLWNARMTTTAEWLRLHLARTERQTFLGRLRLAIAEARKERDEPT